jgi:hypothetical protein
MGLIRGSMTLPRMNAYRLVVGAAAVTVAVAAALTAALATFASQALPGAVRLDLARAPNTALVITGNVSGGQYAQYTAQLPGRISAALDGTAFGFYQAQWSDPLGFVPDARPAAPDAGAGTTQTIEAASLTAVTGQAVLVSGRWPAGASLPGTGTLIPAALPASTAALLQVTTGDVLQFRDRLSGRLIRFAVTGLYRPRQVSAPYWGLDEIAPSGSSTVSGFTTYGPLTVAPAAFGGPLSVAGGSWLAQPQTASIPQDRLAAVAAQVNGLQEALGNATPLPDLNLTTGLPAVLTGTASNLAVARSLLAICAVLLALLAAAALLAVARLLASQRESEAAMLVARGAGRGQLARGALAEAAPVCLLGAVVGGLAGVALARLLAGTGVTGLGVNGLGVPGLGAAQAGAGEVRAGLVGWPAVWAAAATGAGALVIMLVPVLGTFGPGAVRGRRGRQAAIAGITRAGADLALIALAVLAGAELQHYSAVSAGASGDYGVDPVIVVAPALALAGGTVLALRLLPAGGKAGDRLAARGRRLTTAMASWQISRQPIRQGGAALLIVLAVATGTLALSQRQSWTRSAQDQAAFAAGADVRVQTSQPLSAAQASALLAAPGVRHAMPVASFPQPDTGGETLAVDSSRAAQVTLLRPDQSALPATELFGQIAAGSRAGITLPGGSGFRLTARLGATTPALGAATVSVFVADATGNVYPLSAGTLAADGRDHTLAVSAGAGVRPLRLTGVSVAYPLPAARPRGPVSFTLAGISGSAGTVPGSALRGWPAVATSSGLAQLRQVSGGVGGPSGLPAVASTAVTGGALTVAFGPGYARAASGAAGPVTGQLALTPAAPVAIPGLATQAYLGASNTSVGSTVQTDVGGATVSVKIVAAVRTFPTISGRGGGLVVDLGALQTVLLSHGALAPAPVTQWWLATTGTAGVPAGLASRLPPGSAVTSANGIAADLLANPLSTVPQQGLLAVAVAAAVLAITGFCVSIAAGIRQRRAETALLAALGVAPRAAAAQLCLEKLMLSGPAAAAGLGLGVVLAELLVPAITLTAAATEPVPPVLIQFGWAQTLPLALAVAVLPVLAAALTLARRPDPAAGLRAAESA